MESARVLLLDIEGTTTPISFVYDTLFPFARQHVDDFLRDHRDADGVASNLTELAAAAREDANADHDVEIFSPDDVERAANYVRWLMDRDRKTTALKDLQGKIWRAGYEDGRLRGAVFEDVPDVLERLADCGIRTYIYSSGSVAAQKLLFANSTAGDLTEHIDGYFDTTTGPKKSPDSYTTIASSVSVRPDEVVFATDNLDEARAADQAGVRAVIVDRPGNAPLGAHDFEVWSSLEPALQLLTQVS